MMWKVNLELFVAQFIPAGGDVNEVDRGWCITHQTENLFQFPGCPTTWKTALHHYHSQHVVLVVSNTNGEELKYNF